MYSVRDFCHFLSKFGFLSTNLVEVLISNSTKMRPVGERLILVNRQTDGWADMTNLISPFHDLFKRR
jgi:hypothetical protein